MFRLAIAFAVLAGVFASVGSTGWAGPPRTNSALLHGSQFGRAQYSSRTGPRRLPTSRTYYNGHYYGNFNNRFYGPQYGYF
jgi:hypothetical protein